jgi:hypothetical protein
VRKKRGAVRISRSISCHEIGNYPSRRRATFNPVVQMNIHGRSSGGSGGQFIDKSATLAIMLPILFFNPHISAPCIPYPLHRRAPLRVDLPMLQVADNTYSKDADVFYTTIFDAARIFGGGLRFTRTAI